MKNKWLAKGVEYYPETDTILLIRCPKCGRENYALAVAKGICDDAIEAINLEKSNRVINSRKA